MSEKAERRRERARRRRGNLDDERPLAPSPERLKEAPSREVRVLYVGCEGESTEPDYLRYLNDRFGDGGDGEGQHFRIQPVYRKNGLSPTKTVETVLGYAAEDEAWALFDRDQHNDIPHAVEYAADHKVEIAFSHPSFELWLLLHFQAFSGEQSGSNNIVLEKLRKKAGFRDYDKSVKDPQRKALAKREKTAIGNARSLVKSCAHGSCHPGNAETEPVERDAKPLPPQKWSARSGHAPDCPILGRDPSSDVWRLLVSLGIG